MASPKINPPEQPTAYACLLAAEKHRSKSNQYDATENWGAGLLEKPADKDFIAWIEHLIPASSSTLSDDHEERIQRLESLVKQRDETLEQHGRAIAQMQKMLAEPPSTERDEYAVWVESKDADQYSGMYVAFVPGEGPIAAASTIKELRSKFKEHPLAKRAAIVSVPNAAH
jgi:hypothetical protein